MSEVVAVARQSGGELTVGQTTECTSKHTVISLGGGGRYAATKKNIGSDRPLCRAGSTPSASQSKRITAPGAWASLLFLL
jgi:hypothetical protein